jgi:hypothetical protein
MASSDVTKNKERRNDAPYLNDEHHRIARNLPRV